MTNTDNSRRKDDARPAETLHWDAACSICAGAGTTFGKTCVCRAAEAKRLTLTDALRQAACELLEHNAAAGACIEIAGEPPLYVLVGAASVIGKLLPDAASGTSSFDFRTHLARQAEWSEKTFGPGMRTAGVCDHIRKELLEIEADPADLREWIDVAILALDGAWRCGGAPDQIIDALVAKQTKNEGRNWPDWRTADPNKAIEHDRSTEPTGR